MIQLQCDCQVPTLQKNDWQMLSFSVRSCSTSCDDGFHIFSGKSFLSPSSGTCWTDYHKDNWYCTYERAYDGAKTLDWCCQALFLIGLNRLKRPHISFSLGDFSTHAIRSSFRVMRKERGSIQVRTFIGENREQAANPTFPGTVALDSVKLEIRADRFTWFSKGCGLLLDLYLHACKVLLDFKRAFRYVEDDPIHTASNAIQDHGVGAQCLFVWAETWLMARGVSLEWLFHHPCSKIGGRGRTISLAR